MSKYCIVLSVVICGMAVVCLVGAWHPEKKVMKWNPAFFRPPAYRMCGNKGSPCGSTQKQYGVYWRSTACCFGLDCTNAGHGSFCSEPMLEEDSLEQDSDPILDPDSAADNLA